MRCLHVPQNIWKLRSPPWRFWWHSLKAASSSSLCRGRVPMKCWRFCRFPCRFIKGSYGSFKRNTIGWPSFWGMNSPMIIRNIYIYGSRSYNPRTYHQPTELLKTAQMKHEMRNRKPKDSQRCVFPCLVSEILDSLDDFWRLHTQIYTYPFFECLLLIVGLLQLQISDAPQVSRCTQRRIDPSLTGYVALFAAFMALFLSQSRCLLHQFVLDLSAISPWFTTVGIIFHYLLS